MKAVIVGCGSIADVHAKSLKQMPHVELTAFADIKKNRAESFASKFGGKAYASLEEMLKFEVPDVVHICTPHYLHVPMAIQALNAGVHVFMEKPPVINEEQFAQLKEAAESVSVKLGLCYQNRYNLSVQKAKELLTSGQAGKVLGARGIVTWSRNESYYTKSDWRGCLSTEGGGALMNQSIHTLDLLLYLLGKPVWTEASMSNHHLKEVIEVEDTLEAYICFENANACFYATNAYCSDVPPLIELECENVRIRIEGAVITLYYADGRVETSKLDEVIALGKSYWGSGHGACIADFYDCIVKNRRFRQELLDMEDSIRLTLAIYKSARTGLPVSLEEIIK